MNHAWARTDDDWFCCVNCGTDLRWDDIDGECKPCAFCTGVHSCTSRNGFPWDPTHAVMDPELASAFGPGECECCWLASK
jgi:hypothetical protein